MHEDDPRFQITVARRMLQRAGCDSFVAGQVSTRAEDGTSFWITPFESFGETTPDRVVRLTSDLTVFAGDVTTSPAAAFHSVIFRERPDVQAIVHTHSFWVTVAAAMGRPIGMYNTSAAIFFEEQGCYVDDGIQRSVDGHRMLDALGERSVLLMVNHGALIVGPTLQHATVTAIVLERMAHLHVECERSGARELPVPELKRLKDAYRIHFFREMWDSSYRQLRQTDPEIFELLA